MTKLTTAARSAVRDRFPNLAKDVKSFPVRDGEEPGTRRAAEELAAGLLAEKARLEGELAVADEARAHLLRPAGAGAGDGPRAAPTPTATDAAASALSSMRRVIGLAETVGW